MPTFIRLWVSHLQILSPALYPADFNPAGRPHGFVLHTAHVHMALAKYKFCLAGSSFLFLCFWKCRKKMCNVCPLQKERDFEEVELSWQQATHLTYRFGCGCRGSGDCPVLCQIGATELIGTTLFNGGQATSWTTEPSDWAFRGWFSKLASASFYSSTLIRSVCAAVTTQSSQWHNTIHLWFSIHATCPASVGCWDLLTTDTQAEDNGGFLLQEMVCLHHH